MQARPEGCEVRLDLGRRDESEIASRVNWGRWVCLGILAGVLFGISTALGPSLVFTWNEQRELFLDVGTAIIAAFVGGVAGLFLGPVVAAADQWLPSRVPRLLVAMMVGGIGGSCLPAFVHQPLQGWMVGTATGFCAGVWATNPKPQAWEKALPLRGRWLWFAVTGVVILATPLVVWN